MHLQEKAADTASRRQTIHDINSGDVQLSTRGDIRDKLKDRLQGDGRQAFEGLHGFDGATCDVESVEDMLRHFREHQRGHDSAMTDAAAAAVKRLLGLPPHSILVQDQASE